MSTKPQLLYRVSADAEQPVDISINNIKGSTLTNQEIDANMNTIASELSYRATERDPHFTGLIDGDSKDAILVPGGPALTNLEMMTIKSKVEKNSVRSNIDGLLRWNTEKRGFEYYDNNKQKWILMASMAVGGAKDNRVAFVNDTEIKYDMVIQENQNAVSAGPMTVNNGVSLSLEGGSTYTVL